jgi:hypothetical protein
MVNLRAASDSGHAVSDSAYSAICALHDSNAFAVSLATVVAVCPKGDLMPVGVASEVAGPGLACAFRPARVP